jgi:rRNA-processing protein FCF1
VRFAPALPSTLLIDTNLLLVLLVGDQDRLQVPRFKRTSRFTPEDYDLLAEFVAAFREVVITPNVLTEVSNLAGQLREPLRTQVFDRLGDFASQAGERYVPSREVVEEHDFARFGLTDLSVVLAARERFAVLTDDLGLYLRLMEDDVHVVNFNHLRATTP